MVQDGSEDSPKSLRQVGGPSLRFSTGWGPFWTFRTGRAALMKVRDGSADLLVGPGRVGGPSGRSRTGRGTLEEVGTDQGTLG